MCTYYNEASRLSLVKLFFIVTLLSTKNRISRDYTLYPGLHCVWYLFLCGLIMLSSEHIMVNI
jgi:hypothetical protein